MAQGLCLRAASLRCWRPQSLTPFLSHKVGHLDANQSQNTCPVASSAATPQRSTFAIFCQLRGGEGGGQTLSGLVNAKSHPLPCAVSMMSHSDVAMPLAASLFSKLLCWLPLVKVKSMHRVRGRSVPTLHPQKC